MRMGMGFLLATHKADKSDRHRQHTKESCGDGKPPPRSHNFEANICKSRHEVIAAVTPAWQLGLVLSPSKCGTEAGAKCCMPKGSGGRAHAFARICDIWVCDAKAAKGRPRRWHVSCMSACMLPSAGATLRITGEGCRCEARNGLAVKLAAQRRATPRLHYNTSHPPNEAIKRCPIRRRPNDGAGLRI